MRNCKEKLLWRGSALWARPWRAFSLLAGMGLAGCSASLRLATNQRWTEEWIASNSGPAQEKAELAAPYYAAALDPGGDQAAWLAQKADFASFNAERLEAEVSRLTNELRRQHKRSPLRINPKLARIARSHSQEMAQLGYISHNSPTPGRRTPEDRMAREGLGFRVSAENIAYEPCLARFWSDGRREFFSWGEVAANTVRHLSESSGHRENLLRRDVLEIGVGAAIASREGRPYVYLTQSFRAPDRDNAERRPRNEE